MQSIIETEENTIQRLREWNIAYRKGKPIVSDRVYDEEYDIAKALYPDNIFFEEVGYVPGDKERERELPIAMASMNKEKSIEELKDWFRLKNIPITSDLVLTPKFDGMSLCVDEETHEATTRGDGIVGQSADKHYTLITNKLWDLKEVSGFDPFGPICFKYTYGEIMMRKDKFNESYAIPNKYNANGFANPRNLVAGLINRPDPSEPLKDTAYIKYGAVIKEQFKKDFKTKSSILEVLNEGQKIKAPFLITRFSELSEEFFIDLFKQWSVDYEIDGIIIEINDLALQQKLGREQSTENPVWARAYKSPAFEQSAETEVTHVEWNISKQGLLKPRLHVKAVKLDGVTVTHATGNNARYVRDNGIGVGAIVKIVRSGMVIPKVVEVLKKVDFVMPDYGNIGWNANGVELITLTASKEQEFKQLVSFFEILEVENAGEGILKQLWEAGYTTVKDILALKPFHMEGLDGFGKRKSENTYNAIQSKMKEVDLAKLQHASGIFKMLGSRKLELLKDFDTKPTLDQVMKIEGFAEKSAQAYIDGYDKFNNFIKDLPITIKKTKFVASSNELKGKTFVFTGVRSDEAEQKIQEMGGKIGSSVSKNTSYLVMKSKGSGSSKEVKAIDLGVTVLTLDELKKLINL
jgi:NAD-dependent DNA ligase